MPASPLSRRELIERLRSLGFSGPYAGKKHMFMEHGSLRIRIPNPHRSDIGVPLLKELLRQAGITEEAWERAG